MSDAEETVVADIVDEEESAIDDSARIPGATNVGSAVATLNDPTSGFYSTLKADTFKERLALGKAVNESTPLDQALNEEFELANYIVQVVDITDSNTGEQIQAPRVTLIDNNGKAYHGTSKGLLTAIRNLNATIGDPSTWEGNTIKVKVIEEGVRPRKYMTIKYL